MSLDHIQPHSATYASSVGKTHRIHLGSRFMAFLLRLVIDLVAVDRIDVNSKQQPEEGRGYWRNDGETLNNVANLNEILLRILVKNYSYFKEFFWIDWTWYRIKKSFKGSLTLLGKKSYTCNLKLWRMWCIKIIESRPGKMIIFTEFVWNCSESDKEWYSYLKYGEWDLRKKKRRTKTKIQ